MTQLETTTLGAWYKANHPTDDLAEYVREDQTFEDLFNAIDRGKDVYEVIGIGDSIVREHLFGELARIIEMPYNYVFHHWIHNY